MTSRFDILNAYYVFAVLWHQGQGSDTYGYLSRLSSLGYKPGMSAQKCELTTEGERQVYAYLCLKHGV